MRGGKSWVVRELKKFFPKMVELKADYSIIDDCANVKLLDDKNYYSEYARKDKEDSEWIVFNPEANNKQ